MQPFENLPTIFLQWCPIAVWFIGKWPPQRIFRKALCLALAKKRATQKWHLTPSRMLLTIRLVQTKILTRILLARRFASEALCPLKISRDKIIRNCGPHFQKQWTQFFQIPTAIWTKSTVGFCKSTNCVERETSCWTILRRCPFSNWIRLLWDIPMRRTTTIRVNRRILWKARFFWKFCSSCVKRGPYPIFSCRMLHPGFQCEWTVLRSKTIQ